MRLIHVLMAGAMLGITCSGCLNGLKAARGRRVFNTLQSAVERAERKTAPSVVYVKLKEMSGGGGGGMRMMGGRIMRSRSSSHKSLQGIILTKEGHILIPEEAKPDEVGRIEVLVGDTEYSAKIVKTDDKLKMTIIKIEPEEDLVPLAIEQNMDLQTGAWCVVIEASDEEKEYATFSTLSICGGEIADRYRQYVLRETPYRANGSPIVALNGKVAGLMQGKKALAMSDLCEDLQEFLADAAEVVSAADEEENGKSWLGLMLEPINREYAKAHDLPKSALWVLTALKDSPADVAGVKVGDLIVGFNGKPLRLSGGRVREYFRKTIRPKIGNEFSVTVLRDGKEVVCSGAYTKKPEEESMRADDIGVTVKRIMDGDVFSQNLFTTEGVLITDIRKGSPAATSSSFRQTLLSKNDVIVEVAGMPTPTLEQFGKALETIRKNKTKVIQITYWRGKATGYAGLNLEKNENVNGDK